MVPNEEKWTTISDAGSNGVEEVVDAVRQEQDGQWAQGYKDPTWGLGRPLRVFVRVEDGEWTGLCILGSPGSPLTLEGIRDARLGDLVDFTVELSAVDWSSVEQPDRAEEEVLGYRPGPRARMTDYHLRMVAGVYRIAKRTAPARPQAWCSEWWGVTPVRVSRWIAAARERGLLGEGE